MSETFVVCVAGIDLPWARWIAFQVQEANANALIDAGTGYALNDFESVIARSNRILVVLSPEALADHTVRARWAAVEPARLVGVVVRPCDPHDFPAAAPLIELHGIVQGAGERLLGALGPWWRPPFLVSRRPPWRGSTRCSTSFHAKRSTCRW